MLQGTCGDESPWWKQHTALQHSLFYRLKRAPRTVWLALAVVLTFAVYHYGQVGDTQNIMVRLLD